MHKSKLANILGSNCYTITIESKAIALPYVHTPPPRYLRMFSTLLFASSRSSCQTQPQRLTVQFSLGLNRGSIWIGNFGGMFVNAVDLIEFATRTWAPDTVMRPTFAHKGNLVKALHVTFSSCEAAT